MITKASNKKLALTIQGQELIWGYNGQGIQGMTELVQCERNHDEWLQELQDQLRHGELSDENHDLLHGRMTAGKQHVSASCNSDCPQVRSRHGNVACANENVRPRR